MSALRSLSCAALLGACVAPPSPIDGDWIDLTHGFSSETVYWPTAEGFELITDAKGMTEDGYWYEANSFRAAEHGGTHIDAPVHFARGKQSTAEIPIERLIGPAVVIDVTEAALADPDYRIDIADFEAFEAAHGRIREGVIVLLRTGFGRFWPDRVRYMGTDERGLEATFKLHFPGLHPRAATWLVEQRSVDAVGIDTPSIDYGRSRLFETHRILFQHEVPAFENVANLEALPATGAYVFALPMKIEGGSGGPLRIAAFLPVGS